MRRPHTLRVSVGRSVGEAEHHPTSTLSRVSVLMVAGFLALASLALPAGAQSTADEIERTQAEVDDLAEEWFAAQADAAALDREIQTLEQQVAEASARADEIAKVASARAVQMYMGSGTTVDGLLTADDALGTARGVQLLEIANADGQAAIDDLERAAGDLAGHRADLDERRAAQGRLLADLEARRGELDTRLADLRERAASEAAAAAEARAEAARRARTAASTAAPSRSAPASPAAPAVPDRAPATAPTDVAAPAPPTGGAHPQHDHPFLVCTRARESGGNYQIVSPAGYYGAYQFARTTWDATASHAGRFELVGVNPAQAGVYDQDDMAWTLYQWQGNGPWGGRC